MARIKTISHADASGRLLEIYDELVRKRGKLAEIHQIQSLRPESIVKHMELYMEIMFSKSELSRSEREMMAVAVSVANGCAYCREHHLQAYRFYEKDNSKVFSVINWPLNNVLSDREASLCHFARSLTLDPQSHESNDYTAALKTVGLSDAGILDAVLVIAYFNFVNRIVLSLGLEFTPEEATGYKY
ncbi:MAG: peroxidase-related enzyme [Bacteroidales bacterium]|nr:peroxidase-related enzyme [Bacteroidales bacterium]